MKTEKNIDNLILEVTRKCSCACEHCLRGDVMDIDMPESMIPYIFKNVTNINSITFTGGEPSLNINLIRRTLEYCKKNSIYVGYVWLATNGLQNHRELIHVMDNWLDYCLFCTGYADMDPVSKWMDISEYKSEYSFGLACSIDEFHPSINKNDYEAFRSLLYYDNCKEGSFYSKTGHKQIIQTGKAYDNGLPGFKPTDFMEKGFSVDDNLVEVVYISATGYIYNNCDYSYRNMDDCQAGNSIYEQTIFEIAYFDCNELLNAC